MGAMDKSDCTHVISFVAVDVAVQEADGAAGDRDASSLQDPTKVRLEKVHGKIHGAMDEAMGGVRRNGGKAYILRTTDNITQSIHGGDG